MQEALARIQQLNERAARVGVFGHREYHAGWHTALDLRNLLAVSEAIARSAIERKESRGGHTRIEYPDQDDALARRQVVVKKDGERMAIRWEAQPDLPDDLVKLIKEGA